MKTVKDTLEYRDKNNVQRNDFFQLAMNIYKNNEISFNDLAANCFVFFLAGWEICLFLRNFEFFEVLNFDIFSGEDIKFSNLKNLFFVNFILNFYQI